MSWSLRRAALVSLLIGSVLAASTLAQPGRRRGPTAKDETKKEDKEAAKDDFGESSAISLPRDNKLKAQIEAAGDYIKTEDWVLATEILQKLVGIKEDVFAKLPRKTPDGKDTEIWTSVRAEANRLIASLPPRGLAFYQLTYGPKAAELLKEAKATNKPEILALIMRLYLHTEAGAEATELLGTYHLDRGNYSTASRCFSLLLGRAGSDKLTPVTLFKAAYAFHQTGAAEDKFAEDQTWKLLAGRARDVKFGDGEARSVDELQSYVSASVRPAGEVYASDYPLYRGNPSRSAQGLGSYAFMEARWHQSCLRNPNGDTARWLKAAEEYLRRNNQPVLSSFFPVTATVLRKSSASGQLEKTPLLLFRSNWGIHAVHMKTGKLDWETPSKWSLDGMTAPSSGGGKQQAIQNWMTFYLQLGQQFGGARPAIVFENSTVGTLSTDANFVYAVEDLQVPPPAMPYGPEFGGRFPGQAPNYSSPEVNDAVQHSRLQAFEITTGKLKWELGAPEIRDELSDSYFLGPPLPLGGKLYVLTERQQELRLACIDPTTPPKIVSMQTLATTREKMQADVTRRTEAAHLSYSEGILVCPTNAGAVLGVDLLSNSLVWAYPYREKTEAEEWRPGMGRGGVPIMAADGRMFTPAPAQQWKVSAPVVVDGKVVFTAPDSRSLHCVNLRDGAPLWKATRSEDDQYLAGVFAGRVLIVGRKSARALSLDKGETLWTVETGMPSGQGVASENIYYLPLQSAGQNKEPEICAIDVEKGLVVAHTKSRKKEVPGNLLFYEGDVISQTATAVVAFPQLKVKLAEIDELITKNPDDPAGLTERGVLRLDEGNLQGAIDDLDKALKNKPDARTEERARSKLFETLTEYFQRDFDRAERYLSRYEELCKVAPPDGANETDRSAAEAEEHRRRANFLCLVAKGREKQGKLIEAFELYQQFSSVEGTQELISVVDEPAVRAAPDVWTQGRLAAMAANATPENRKPLEEKLAKRWQEVKAGNDAEELRKFVAVFGSLFAVGKEARLALAQRLIDSSDANALLEAERHLSLLRGPGESPAVAARAVECLARLCTRKGLLEDAAYYYHLLGTRYATEVVREGRTGADVFSELATDKRFLPLLDDPGRRGLIGRVNKAVEERGSYHYNQQIYNFEQRGEPLPFFRSHQVCLQYGGQMHQLRLIDRATGDSVWSPSLTLTHFGNVVTGNGQPSLPRFGYQTLGHLVVLPVADMIFGIDPVHRQVLWERSVYGRQNGGPPAHAQLLVDPHDNGIDVVYPDGWKQRLGQAGPLGGNTVCLPTRDALIALDPVTGRTLWTRSDVGTQSHLFGDQDTLFVVEMGHDEPSSTKALRASDGVTVKVPDFTSVYRKRVRVLGTTILVSESDAKGAPTLRLYDIKSGKDLWKEKFGANARVLQSEEPTLAGVVEADGRVRVFDLVARKEVLNAKVSDPQHLKNVMSVHLLADGHYFYLVCNEALDPAVMPFGGPQALLMPGTGMRALPVNGAVYCFKPDGKVNWYSIVRHQMLVLDQFADLPVVLFASRYQRWGAAGAVRGNVVQVATASALEKQSGKLKYTNDNVPNSMYFHGLTVDPRAGKVEFIGYQMKISFTLDNGATAASAPKVDPAGGGASAAPAPNLSDSAKGVARPR